MAKTAVAQITGVQKAAMLVMSLGVEASAEVFKRLDVEEMRQLSASIASMPRFDDKTRTAVFEEFKKARTLAARPSTKSRNYAADLVEGAIDRESVRLSFEEIINLDDLSIKDVIKRVDLRTLCTALKAADDNIKELIFKNMSDREAAELRAEVMEIGPVRLRQVEAAQESVAEVMRSLLASARKGRKRS